ncbi:MAG: hypothetical protein ACLFOY_04825 [Desulfatibacillaceae bacterium]
MRISRLLLAVLVLCLLSPRNVGAEAEEAPMSAELGVSVAEPWDPVPLRLRFELPGDASLADPLEIGGLGGDVEVASAKRVKDGVDAVLRPVALGMLEIGPVTLAYEGGEAGGTLKSEPLSLSVTAGLGENPDKRQPRPMKGIKEPDRWRRWIPWAAAGAALVSALALLAWWILRRRKSAEPGAETVPPHVRALERLDRAMRDYREARLDTKGYYFALSGILREYMEAIRGFPALEMTVDEIAGRARDRADRDVLGLLREADLVKFAGHRPMETRAESDYEAARRYVEETAPREGLVQTMEQEGEAE